MLLLAAGCGGQSYAHRLDRTLEEMRYRKRLDANLMPPVTKTKLEGMQIFVRPPKNLAQSKEFLLTVLEPGKFDDAESFTETDKQALMHVLARVKLPKAPAKKGAPEAPTAARGDFTSDVIALLNGVYNIEIDATKAKEESKRSNKFKHLAFEANAKNVQVYLFGNKTAHEVALIFEYPKSEQAALVNKIDLSLEAFATGDRARRSFTGSVSEEELSGEGGPASPVAF
jgi:hypothetical protein